MTVRNPGGPGGRIPPQGRPPQTPMPGRQAKRHDLERPATPGLHGSDLQQGDVQMFEQGQQVAPIGKKTQMPNPQRGQSAPAGGGEAGGFSMDVPDPIEFAGRRFGGTFTGRPEAGAATRRADVEPWLPFMRALATNPTAGGALPSRYVEVLSNLQRQPNRPIRRVVNFNDLDDALDASL